MANEHLETAKLDLEIKIDRLMLDVRAQENKIFEEQMNMKKNKKERLLIERRINGHKENIVNFNAQIKELEAVTHE